MTQNQKQARMKLKELRGERGPVDLTNGINAVNGGAGVTYLDNVMTDVYN